MARYDLTPIVGEFLDKHMVFPLLEFLSHKKVRDGGGHDGSWRDARPGGGGTRLAAPRAGEVLECRSC
jgi:hypothetical protein